MRLHNHLFSVFCHLCPSVFVHLIVLLSCTTTRKYAQDSLYPRYCLHLFLYRMSTQVRCNLLVKEGPLVGMALWSIALVRCGLPPDIHSPDGI